MNRLLCRVCTLAGIVANSKVFPSVSSDIPPVYAREKISVLFRSEPTEPAVIFPKGDRRTLIHLLDGMNGLAA